VLNSIIDAITRAIGNHGFPAVLGLMTLESACIPVPSEVIQLFAGYLVSLHRMSLFAAVSAGVLGNLIGSWIAWSVGYYGGRPFIERWGRYIHVTPARLERSERWFDQHGEVAVLIGRCVPVIRTFISLPAGVARMPFWRFSLFTLIGCVPWVLGLTLLGVQVGPSWERWRHRLEYLDYIVVAAIVIGIVYLVVRARRRRGVAVDIPCEGEREWQSVTARAPAAR
jgi:membrane protein DedA with SNARE-associated domain